MITRRRDFLKLSSSVGIASLAGMTGAVAKPSGSIESQLDALRPMTGDVKPITLQEYKARVQKAQRLMREHGIEACFLDAGVSMRYFTGIEWEQSERMLAAVIPAKGEPHYVSPRFELEKLQEVMILGNDVRTWEEDESPYKQVAKLFEDLGVKNKVAMEERVRFFLFDGIRQEAPHLDYVSADPVTIPCRLYKSKAELALLQKAFDITMAAYKVGVPSLREGMTPDDFLGITMEAHSRLGGRGELFCSFGEATAYPHGSSKPQYLKKGDVVLMDGGCTIEGYYSDVSRTIVFGAEPTKRQREIWNLEKAAQAAGFAAAKLGDPAENVDKAARKVITDAGFGPDYKLPGLPHRTGHGIGIDWHEWGNMVRGNKEPLREGMCFSIEPTICIYGEFGVRLEDCVYMTAEGPRWFTQPSPSITQPFAS